MATTRDRPTSALWVIAALAVSLAASAGAWAEDDDNEVTRTGTFDHDIFASARKVTIQADVDGGVIVMGGEVDIRSRVTGDVVSMGGDLTVSESVAGDVIVAGGNLDIHGQIGGDLTATGGNVSIDGSVTGSVLAMGGRTRVGGRIDGDLKAAAGDATLVGAVGGNVMLTGGRAKVSAGADVAGNAWVFGGRVNIDGRIGRDVRAAGRHVFIAGEVMGNVHIDGLEVTILPTARIRGNLTYRSPREADIHTDAQITGDVAFIQSQEPRHVLGRAFAAAGALVFGVIGGLLLLGAVQMLVFPALSLAAAGQARDEPWKAIGLGFAIVVAVPVGIVLLMSTVVGILLGLVIGAAYLIALASGFMTAAVVVGRWGVTRFGRDWDDRAWGRIGMVIIGVLVIAIVGLIPFLGALIALFALALGVGALFLQVWRRDSIPGT